MLLTLKAVLKPDEAALARAWLADAPFVDGRLSAGGVARTVKQNEEVETSAPVLEQLNRLIMGNLLRHADFRAGAFPLHVASPLYARYQPGMAYGDHLDDPVMGAGGVLYRSDVAVTVFLNDPADYDGGALVVNTSFGEQRIKLAAGEAVIYPAGNIHHVQPVTRGERVVAVTWVQSMVREAERRELLYGLNAARERLLKDAPEAVETLQVNAAFQNLLRMWTEL